jgi:phage protein D
VVLFKVNSTDNFNDLMRLEQNNESDAHFLGVAKMLRGQAKIDGKNLKMAVERF